MWCELRGPTRTIRRVNALKKYLANKYLEKSQHPGQNDGLKPLRRRISPSAPQIRTFRIKTTLLVVWCELRGSTKTIRRVNALKKLAKRYLEKSQHPGQNDGLKPPVGVFLPPPHKSAPSESKQPSSACDASYGVPLGPFDVSMQKANIQVKMTA